MNNIKKLRDFLVLGIETYSSHPLLRTLVSLIPNSGPIDAAISSIASSVQERRLYELISFILQNAKFKAWRLTSDDIIYDISVKALKTSIEQRYSEKRKIIADIICEFGQYDDYNFEDGNADVEELLSIVDLINVRDIPVFAAFCRISAPFNYNNNPLLERPAHSYSHKYKVAGEYLPSDAKIISSQWLDRPEVEVGESLRRLTSLSLCKEITGGFLNYVGVCFVLTKLGNDFKEYLMQYSFEEAR